MKLVIRAFAMFVVFVGLTAASVSSATPVIVANQLSATAAGPGPSILPFPPPCPRCQ